MHVTTINPQKLVLLDRDGVINFDSDAYIKSPEEWLPIPGSIEAIAALNNAGIEVCIITNQSGIGRNLFSLEQLSAMHLKLENLLSPLGGSIRRIYFCPHLPTDNCMCRKPNCGMLEALENEFSISVANVPFIGDSEKDLALAFHKNCLPILVKTGKGAQYFDSNFKSAPWAKKSLVFDNLKLASQYLLAEHF